MAGVSSAAAVVALKGETIREVAARLSGAAAPAVGVDHGPGHSDGIVARCAEVLVISNQPALEARLARAGIDAECIRNRTVLA